MVLIEGNTTFCLFHWDRFYGYFDKWCELAGVRPIVLGREEEATPFRISPPNGPIWAADYKVLVENLPELLHAYRWFFLDHQGGQTLHQMGHPTTQTVYAIGHDEHGFPKRWFDRADAFRIHWLPEVHAHIAAGALLSHRMMILANGHPADQHAGALV
jgi:hypothetical protein